jgi:hypothetical protein
MSELVNSLNNPILPQEDSGDRRNVDRRQAPTPIFSRYWLKGRRRGARRDGEGNNIYVDKYSITEVLLVFGILVLSVLDMYFTLVHLDAGGTEANPVMAAFLEWGGYPLFKLVKLATTFLGLGILLVHVRFKKVRTLLGFAFLIYFGVFIFHIYLAFMRAAPVVL